MRRRGVLVGWLSVLVALFQLGCVDWTSIRPTELPKLNGASTIRRPTYNGQVYLATTTVYVERTDGTMARIRGSLRSARVRSNDTDVVLLPPIVAELNGPQMNVRASNVAPTTLDLQSIQSVEVESTNSAKTGALSAFIGIALGGIVTAVILTQI